jgi:hypothetical protein
MQPTTPQPGGASGPEEQDLYRPAQASPYVPAAAHFDEPQVAATPLNHSDAVSWEASEYLHRSKDFLWTIGFIATTAVFLAVAVWFQAWTFAILIVVMAVAMGYFAFRKPRVVHYSLNHDGLQIGQRFYSFADFRAFGVKPEEAFFMALLIPTKRFMPAITIYFAETEGEKIVDILGAHIPMEEVNPDIVDSFMSRLHF